MALFAKTQKNTEQVEDKKVVASVVKGKVRGPIDIAAVLLRPRVTEKASFKAESGVYTFEVTQDATKRRISLAIQSLYKVTPVKINTVKIPKKKKTDSGR